MTKSALYNALLGIEMGRVRLAKRAKWIASGAQYNRRAAYILLQEQQEYGRVLTSIYRSNYNAN